MRLSMGWCEIRWRRRAALAACMLLVWCPCGAPAAEPDAVAPPKPAAADSPPEAPAAKPYVATCPRVAAFRAVIDVGHTEGVPGALSARGATEYSFNLTLAREIDKELRAAGFERTALMITAEGPTIGLFKRVARAAALEADLLLAIHHDSVPDSFLETWQFEGQEQHFSDRFSGHSLFISNDNGDRAGSLAFAKLLGTALEARGLHYTPHYTEKFMGNRRRELLDAKAGVYRYDQLIVLRHSRMPAALLEAGSIINRTEELLMAAPEHQAVIAGAVVEAVDAFCAARSAKPKVAAKQRSQK
jgi:N-acetylmuramoyl-L-alanine amidase